MGLIFDSVNDRISSTSGPVGLQGSVTATATTGTTGLTVNGSATATYTAEIISNLDNYGVTRLYNASVGSSSAARLRFETNGGAVCDITTFRTGGTFIETYGTNPIYIRTGNAAINFWTNSVSRLTISSTGAITIAAPTSGVPLTVNGGKIAMAASTTAYSSANLPHGVAPTSPVDGDVWTTTGGLFARINGTTLDFAPKASPTFTGTTTVADLVVTGSSIPQNSQSADYTLVAADANKHVLHPAADTTARTFTIPANSSVPYAIGTAITFINQNSAGVVTIAITTDTMRLAGAGTTGSRTLAANGVATALKITSTEWIISGTGLT